MNKVGISHRIELYFNKLGWNKTKFAKAIGEYPQHLNKVFEGKLDPLKYIDNLVKIGCDKEWLLTGKEKPLIKEADYGYNVIAPNEESNLLKELYDKTHRDREVLRGQLFEAHKEILKLKDEIKKLKGEK